MQAIAGIKFFSPLEGRNRVQGCRTFCSGSSIRPSNLALTEEPLVKISKGAVSLSSSFWGSRQICMEKRMNLGLTNKRGGSSKIRAKAYGKSKGRAKRSSSVGATSLNGKDMSKVTCFACQKAGHYASQCPDSIQEEGQERDTGSSISCD